MIQNPIDLKMIATKIQRSQYKSLDDLERDLMLMVKNAKAFNEPKSLIYRVSLAFLSGFFVLFLLYENGL